MSRQILERVVFGRVDDNDVQTYGGGQIPREEYRIQVLVLEDGTVSLWVDPEWTENECDFDLRDVPGDFFRIIVAHLPAFTGQAMSERLQQMIVRLPPDMHRAVKECAEREDRTISQTIRRALRFYLERPAEDDRQ